MLIWRNDERRCSICIPLNTPRHRSTTPSSIGPLFFSTSPPSFFSPRALITRFTHSKYAGFHKAIAACGRASASCRPEKLQLHLELLCRYHSQPSHQRRHQGAVPGLHRQAGNVSCQSPVHSFRELGAPSRKHAICDTSCVRTRRLTRPPIQLPCATSDRLR